MAELKKELSIFISYAREDIEAAKRLYGDLQKKGIFPWFDQKSILAGKKWKFVIREAIKDCRYFLALLSSNSVNKKGFVNKEITLALEILEEYPESGIYIIPVRLDDCIPTHEKLKELHWVDMFPNKWEEGLGEILRTVINDLTKKKDELDGFVNDLSEIYFSGKYETEENIQKIVVDSYLENFFELPVLDGFVDLYTSICKRDKKFYTIQELWPILQKRLEDAEMYDKTKASKDYKKVSKIPEHSETEEGLIAIIVGIDGYKDRIAKPHYCAVNDAVYLTETLKKVWIDRKVLIKTLIWPSLNENKAKKQKETWGIELPNDATMVTREGILSVVKECADQALESDLFIFYFSGGGALLDDEPALISIRDGKTAKGIEMIKIREIQEAVAECASTKKVMILDCTQSPLSKHKPVEGYRNLKDLTQGWSIFLSASPGEVSLEDQYFGDRRDDYLQQGVFTASLVEGLRGEAIGSSGSVSLADLAYFVGKRVPVEYQERLSSILTRKETIIFFNKRKKEKEKNQVKINETEKVKEIDQKSTFTKRMFYSQNPVLLGDSFATGGPYHITIAPVHVPTSQRARRKTPTKIFIKNWSKFLIGYWPISFPYRGAFRLAALVYAATMMLTVLMQSPKAIDATILIFSGGVGLGSAFIWWITLPFTVAVNEDRWHSGGYLTLIFYLIWHCIVALGFSWICGINQINSTGFNRIIYLGIDLFFIYGVVVVYGCNTSQVIIALAETIRSDERREIRQAIRAFQQFRYTRLGVDLYSFVPNISLRPDFYFYTLVISITIIALHYIYYYIMVNVDVETIHMGILLMRNISIGVLVTWMVFWYLAAFKYIQREVYRR